MKLQRVLFIGLFWLLNAGSSYGGGFGAPAFDAYVFRSTIWPAGADGIHEIPVCWLDFDDSTEQERNWVRDAVRRTWESVSLARFTGWEECTVPAANFDGVAIEVGAGRAPHTDWLGSDIATQDPPHGHGMFLIFDAQELRGY